MILEQVSSSVLLKNDILSGVFFSAVLSVRNSDLKCSDLHRLRQHCLEIGNETPCFQVLRPTCKQTSRVCGANA